MSEINYACVQYLDDKVKYYYEKTTVIFYKKKDKNHITPQNYSDYDPKHKYFILYKNSKKNPESSCDTTHDSDNSQFYQAYIICLGVSETDARNRASNKPKRFIFPKKLTSSDSFDDPDESKEDLKPKTGKIISTIVQKENTERTLQKYKQQTLLNNRRNLSFSELKENNGEDEQETNPKKIANMNPEVCLIRCTAPHSVEKNDHTMKDYENHEFSPKMPLSTSTPKTCPTEIAHTSQKKSLQQKSDNFNKSSPSVVRKSFGFSESRSPRTSPSQSSRSRSLTLRSEGLRLQTPPSARSGVAHSRTPPRADAGRSRSQSQGRSCSEDFHARSRRSPSRLRSQSRMSHSKVSPSRTPPRVPTSETGPPALSGAPSALSATSPALSGSPSARSRASNSRTPPREDAGRSRSRSQRRSRSGNSYERSPRRSPHRSSPSRSSLSRSQISRSQRLPRVLRSETPSPVLSGASNLRPPSRADSRLSRSRLQRPSCSGDSHARSRRLPSPSSRSRISRLQVSRPRLRSRSNCRPSRSRSRHRSRSGASRARTPHRSRSQVSRSSTQHTSGSRHSRSRTPSRASRARTPRRASRSRTPRRSRSQMSQLPSFRGPSLSPIPAVRRPSPRSKTVNTIQRPPLQDRTNRPVDNVGDVSQATASNHEAAESAFAMLREYKPKLFKKYVKAGYDVQSEIHETHERYEIVNDKVYLGLNVDVGQKTWRMINRQRKSRFLRDLGAVLWTKKTLANRCLDISKTKEKQLNGQPIQLLSPRKLDLYLSLYNDYLNKSRYYAHLDVDNKDILIKNSTESLSFHIRDEKKAQSCNE